MIMANGDGGERLRKRSSGHPWNHPELRLHSNNERDEPRCCKVTMTVTRSEFRAIRARAGSRTVSEFLRGQVNAEILQPVPDSQSDSQ
jgi:hypothetical protein